MTHHARVEELSDSDPSEMDPSDAVDAAGRLAATGPTPAQAQAHAEMLERSKRWQCIYPVYFDASRTRAEGRRVSRELAVSSPLAHEMKDAVAALGLAHVVLEPFKTHPKDWSNPGRVRVLVKTHGGGPVHPRIKNKHHLYNLVAAYLKEHPTTEDSPMRQRILGMPLPKELKPPVVPRGWKISPIVPLHSPALGGDGVNEDMFKGVMPGSGNASDSGTGGKKKKDKKKGRA